MRNHTTNFPELSRAVRPRQYCVAAGDVGFWLHADLPRPLSPVGRSKLTEGNVWLPAMLRICTAFQSTFPTCGRLASRCNSAAGSSAVISTGTRKENDQT